MLKYRILCVSISVVFLVALGVGLYGSQTPNIPLLYIFGCLCLTGLIGNAILSVAEMQQQQKKMRESLENMPQNHRSKDGGDRS